MANIIVVCNVMVKIFFLLLTLTSLAHAKLDTVHSETYLGEKNVNDYAERYQPLILHDMYRGKLTFQDEVFFQNFFDPYLLPNASDYSFFLKSELNAGMVCSNDLLSEHFDDIRFSYRLITLSYLLEGAWHLKLMSDHLGLKKGCTFDLKSWIKTCGARSQEMKTFVKRLEQFLPRYNESLPAKYSKNNWWKEFSGQDFKYYSHYRLSAECDGKCKEDDLPGKFQKICENDQKLMTLVCSEMDEIYGLSTNRDAYYLLGLSNIINTFNKRGEAMGCLRRFSEVMAHKEVHYGTLNHLFPSLQSFLRQKYQERFLQGRVFFFGAGKEFEEKGLTDLYVKEQPLKIEKLPKAPEVQVTAAPKKEETKVEVKSPEVVKVAEEPKKVPLREIKKPVKSAFLMASEIRAAQDLERVDVDMLKLKYDYVFSLYMINTLSERLKNFMTRDALVEMVRYDKLGTKEGPVPLLFLKYMIDMQEHHGLWNITSIIGDKFYVSNEIDSAFNPKPEFIQLLNNDSTGRQWQIFILRPD